MMTYKRHIRIFTSALVFMIGMGGKSMAQQPVTTEYVTVQTSMGTFEIGLYRKDAPKTVENFVQLAKRKFFDGIRVHRVAKGFVMQTGDEKSKNTAAVNEWGTGGQSIYPHKSFDKRASKTITVYTFNDELNPDAPSYKEGYRKGVVAMANSGPNTNTSQFFVMLNDNTTLPKNYTIFGKVVSGMDVVDKIGSVDVTPVFGPTDGRPKADILIKKVSMKSSGHSAP
jgi:cyclophilin family peptidyl-prolyl cis-trans isomerase